MFTFAIIYIIVLFGFSQAYFFLYKGHENVEETPYGTYFSTWMGLFQTTLGDYDVSLALHTKLTFLFRGSNYLLISWLSVSRLSTPNWTTFPIRIWRKRFSSFLWFSCRFCCSTCWSLWWVIYGPIDMCIMRHFINTQLIFCQATLMPTSLNNRRRSSWSSGPRLLLHLNGLFRKQVKQFCIFFRVCTRDWNKN